MHDFNKQHTFLVSRGAVYVIPSYVTYKKDISFE